MLRFKKQVYCREAGKCSKVVPDRGDRCLFIFLWSHRLFCKFPYPVCKAQLIGDWYENRRGARNTIILPIIRQYYCVPMPPAPIVMTDRTRGKNVLAHCAWPTVPGQHWLLAEGDIGAPIYWCTDAPRAITIGAPIHTAPLLSPHRSTLRQYY